MFRHLCHFNNCIHCGEWVEKTIPTFDHCKEMETIVAKCDIFGECTPLGKTRNINIISCHKCNKYEPREV